MARLDNFPKLCILNIVQVNRPPGNWRDGGINHGGAWSEIKKQSFAWAGIVIGVCNHILLLFYEKERTTMNITVQQQSLLIRYLNTLNGASPNSAAAAFYA